MVKVDEIERNKDFDGSYLLNELAVIMLRKKIKFHDKIRNISIKNTGKDVKR
jgi:hypothetical protein